MREIETIERSQLREDVTPFIPGDTVKVTIEIKETTGACLLYTSPSPRD